MSKTYKNIKGTFDIVPDPSISKDASPFSSGQWIRIERVVRDVVRRYGMQEIRTPILEPLDLIARGIGQLTDIVSKEMFAFSRDNTDYVLRPEITAPVVRAYLQHNMSQLLPVQQLFYIGPCFRAERPQKGRYRQFHQFGAEIIGEPGPMADVEVIRCMVDIYKELGITNMELRLNSLGDETSRPQYKAALQEYLEPHRNDLSETSRSRLEDNVLRILDTKNPDEQRLLQDAPRLSAFIDSESEDHFNIVCEMVDKAGIPFVHDPFLVRGLDYYTRTAFELESPDLGAQSALAGGGRYDLLATELGSKNPVPAVGFAAGIERLLIAVSELGDTAAIDDGPDIYIASLGDTALKWAIDTAAALRSDGGAVVTALAQKSLKAQLKDASKRNARYAIIVGEDELQSSVATVRDLRKSTQEEIPFASLPTLLKRS
ncbi:MAG: histidine--tRNA ligase [Rhodothermales bacterium]|nr:histidine--tRNA ligase [Rhodothermales bacterium]